MTGALTGYRVLELTEGKGMLCGRLLAEMGADVIRIEEPGELEDTLSYLYPNAGKKRITLRLDSAAGQDIMKRLVKTADVLLESQSPGYLDSVHLGYDVLNQINPGLVVASLTDFGQTGPYRSHASGNLVTAALGGQVYITGEANNPPLKPYGESAYDSACLFTAIGVLLALRSRQATGLGQHLDISALESAAATLDHVLVRYWYEGIVARRQGGLWWNSAFHIFPCRDGYALLALTVGWETLVELMAAEGMAQDLTEARWLDSEERSKQIDHVIGIIERWTRTHTVAELVETGQMMRLPWGEVSSITDLFSSPQLNERDYFTSIEYGGRFYRSAGAPCRMSASPFQAGDVVVQRGEDNLKIYQELGFSAKKIQGLSRDGVI